MTSGRRQTAPAARPVRVSVIPLGTGLLGEVSVLVAPYLVGDGRRLLDGLAQDGPQRLQLLASEAQPDGHLWVRCAVTHS